MRPFLTLTASGVALALCACAIAPTSPEWPTVDLAAAALVKKIKAAANFNQGFQTTEYFASALVDMKYHTSDRAKIDPDKVEKETLDELGMPSELPMRHRSTQFGHIFSGEDEEAGAGGQ